MKTRIGGMLPLVLACVIASVSVPIQAQDTAAASAAAEEHLMQVFALKFTDASDALDVVHAMSPEINMQVDPRGNLLLVSGTPEQVEVVGAILEVLDRQIEAQRAAEIDIELAVIEQTIAGDEAAVTEFEWAEVDADAILDGEAELAGRVSRTEIRMRAVDGQNATFQSGGTVAVAEGRMSEPRGGGFRTSYRRESIGTIVNALATIRNSRIVVELEFESSQAAPGGDSEAPGGSQTLTSRSTLSLRPGEASVVSGTQSSLVDSKGPRHTRTLLIVRAQEVE